MTIDQAKESAKAYVLQGFHQPLPDGFPECCDLLKKELGHEGFEAFVRGIDISAVPWRQANVDWMCG